MCPPPQQKNNSCMPSMPMFKAGERNDGDFLKKQFRAFPQNKQLSNHSAKF